MTLLHAAWLTEAAGPRLLLWADTWRVATGRRLDELDATPVHPLALSAADLSAWLRERELLPEGGSPRQAQLTLPSRSSGLPLMAGEPLPRQLQWWPWRLEGLVLDPAAAGPWLEGLPLSGDHPDLGDDLRWWAHLQRWVLSLVARGRWLPLVTPPEADGRRRALWQPLLNHEDDRRRLEDLAARLPQVVAAADPDDGLACRRPGSARMRVAAIVSALLDGQLRQPPTNEIGRAHV